MNALNTPLKRVGFIIMVIGLSLFFLRVGVLGTS